MGRELGPVVLALLGLAACRERGSASSTTGAPPTAPAPVEAAAPAAASEWTGVADADWEAVEFKTPDGQALVATAPVEHTVRSLGSSSRIASAFEGVGNPQHFDVVISREQLDELAVTLAADAEVARVERPATDWLVAWMKPTDDDHADIVLVMRSRTVAGRALTCRAAGLVNDEGKAEIRRSMAICASLRAGE